ncbi:MAG TPA: hypothetical protein VNM72_04680 [Blastocatellia bacterium]|nr:hypothetical protein [Blastocatellia bacterium]
MIKVPVDVREYSGYRADERPASFHYLGTVYVITSVIGLVRELTSDGRLVNRFDVQVGDDHFTLLHDETEGQWYLLVEKPLAKKV